MRCALLVAVVSFLSSAYFANAMNTANVTTRMAVSLSIVQEHRLTIDPYAPYILDKAFDGRHFYSDKAPGMSLLALPAAAFSVHVLYPAGTAWMNGKVWTNAYKNVAWICTFSTSGVMVAIGSAALFLLALRLTGDAMAALFASTAYTVGMPTLGWASTMFGHAPSGAMLMTGYSLLVRTRPGASTARLAMAGFCLGLATLIELPAGMSAAIVTLGWLGMGLRDGIGSILRRGSPVLIGGIAGLTPLFIYNTLAFGGPLAFGYSYVVGFDGMQTGFFGIGVPNLNVAGEVLFGAYRGLLPVAPIVVLVPISLWACWQSNPGVSVTCGIVMLWYIALNSGYIYWDGGYAVGPRHLAPMLSFAALPMAFLWHRGAIVLRTALLVLLAASMAMAVTAAGVGMVPMYHYRNEVMDYFLPALRANRFTEISRSLFAYGSPLNALPVVALWVAAFMMFRWLTRSESVGQEFQA